MFYGAVVVPVGTRVLGSETTQGFITQQVTWWLNVCGLVAVSVWLWVLTADAASRRWFALWGLIALSLVGQLVLHEQMGTYLDIPTHSVLDPDAFYRLHRAYLIVSTLQWLAAIRLCSAIVALGSLASNEDSS